MSGVPYAKALGGRDPVAAMAETPGRLRAVLGSYTADEIEASPAPGKWSLREIMCHLADCEIVWAWRLRQAWEGADPEVTPFEQDAWSRMYKVYTMADAEAVFAAVRAWNLAFVRGLSEADKQKVVVHPERGQERLWTIVEIMAGHDLHHLGLLEGGV